MQKATGVSTTIWSSTRSGDTVTVGDIPIELDPHAGPHAGQPVLPRRRPAGRRRHAVPRRLRPHRPARRRSRRALREHHPAAGRRCPTTPSSIPGHLYSAEPSATMGETRTLQLRVPPEDARAVAHDVRQLRLRACRSPGSSCPQVAAALPARRTDTPPAPTRSSCPQSRPAALPARRTDTPPAPPGSSCPQRRPGALLRTKNRREALRQRPFSPRARV